MFNFKTTDDKILELGYSKTKDDRYRVMYERIRDTYTQVVVIIRQDFRRSVLLSYEKDVLGEQGEVNSCVGLSYKELKLFTKKMKELKLDKY